MFIDLEQLLNLSAVSGVGPSRLRNLIAHFRSPEAVFQASSNELTQVEGVDYKTAQQIRNYKKFHLGKEEVEKAKALDINIIHFWEEAYPVNLKRIFDPPVLIYVKGELKKDDRFAVCIVGTRLSSSYGKLVAEKISKELTRLGVVVVSGFARGIDTVSHWAAVNNRGRTLAVLGSGLDKLYPAENKKLAELIEKNGALISEFSLGTGPDAPNFPRRNRIIAGLSLGTVVVEAGLKSGALLTANFALEQNREVFAVPGNINSAKSIGTNQLIKSGARLVSSVNDIIQELEPQLRPLLNAGKLAEKVLPANLNGAEKKVLNSLSSDPIHIDKLAQAIGKTTSETLSILLTLEFKDLVKQLPGTNFIKI